VNGPFPSPPDTITITGLEGNKIYTTDVATKTTSL